MRVSRLLPRWGLPIVVALTMTAASTPALVGAAQAAPTTTVKAAAAKKKLVRTNFAVGANGYGTRVRGGQIPAQSETQAFAVIGCTNWVGNLKRNHIAKVELPGLGVVDGVDTKVWTEKKGKQVHVWSTHEVAKVTIADTPLGSLFIRGVESMSHTWWAGGKFHAKTSTKIATIVLKPAVGPEVPIEIPTVNTPITVPGLAVLTLGKHQKKVSAKKSARAAAAALKIKVIPTNTNVIVAQTRANIAKGVKNGVFAGYSAGLEGSVLQDVANIGRTPYKPMPCEGTDGKDVLSPTVGLNLNPLAEVGAVVAGVNGKPGKNKATATTAAAIADVSLLDGNLIIKGVTAKATVTRNKKNKLTRSSKGTNVLEVIAAGQSYTMPDTGPLEIPGLAKLEPKVIKKLPNGLKVVGLRVTLLTGTLATIDLAVAQSVIRNKNKQPK